MSHLIVRCDADMGPLEVSVYPPNGEPIEFTLSSGATEKSLLAQAGLYAVVARRPNGSRLRETVKVGSTDAWVLLSSAVKASPNEFMTPENARGQVSTVPADEPASGWRGALAGMAGAVLRGAMVNALSPILGFTASEPRTMDTMLNLGFENLVKTRPLQELTVRAWRLSGDGWSPLTAAGAAGIVTWPDVSRDFLKLRVMPNGGVLSIGLLDAKGFGPIVAMAPFAEPVELTFVSKGVLVRADDRTASPGGQRIPVALVTPSNLATADLLATLASSATPQAQAIWDQTMSGLVEPSNAGAAEEMLFEKFERPAEALLAAHYLLRFLPTRLPVAWADRLTDILPLVADGPVIAAWLRILSPQDGATSEAIDKEVERNVILALGRPVTLFARTRALLLDARHLLSNETGKDRWARQGIFRRHGAEAGGLECFWGGGPDLPGQNGDASPAQDIMRVALADGAFAEQSVLR